MKNAKSTKSAKKSAAPKKPAARLAGKDSGDANLKGSTAAKMGLKGTDSRSDQPKQQDVHDIHRDGNADRDKVRSNMSRKRG